MSTWRRQTWTRVGKTKKPQVSWYLSGLYNIELISKVQTAWSQLWQLWEPCSRAVMCLFHSPHSELRTSEGNRVQDVSCSKKVVLFSLLQPFAWGECIKKKKKKKKLRASWSVTYITEDKEKKQKQKQKQWTLPEEWGWSWADSGGVNERSNTLVLQISQERTHTSSSGIKNALRGCILPLTRGDRTRHQSPI